jgi:hypothetical protein
MKKNIPSALVVLAGVFLFSLFVPSTLAATRYHIVDLDGTIVLNGAGSPTVTNTLAECQAIISGQTSYRCVAFQDAISCSSLVGQCQGSCVATSTITGATDCSWPNGYCCTTDGTINTTGANACTGHDSKVTGRCNTNCAGWVADGVCSGTRNCCVPASALSTGTGSGAGGTPTGTGTPTGVGTGSACSGTCKPTCDTAAGETVGSGTCTSSTQSCCMAAGSSGGGATSVLFTNPLKFETVEVATATFLIAFQGIIVMLALIFLVLGGIFYITSGGDSKKIETAKAMITAAMIGLAIGVAAPSFLKEIGNILGWGGAKVPAEVSSARSAIEVAQAVLDFLLSIVGLLAMVMLVVGGLMFFAAAGDEKRAETAKGIVKYSVVGVAVAIVSLIIVRTIAGLF